MKICFWSTTFQADNQALAYHLAEQPDCSVLVAMERPDVYATEAIQRLISFGGRFIDRRAPQAGKEIDHFAADIVVLDNHVPPFPVAHRVFVLWHGFGWRLDDLSQMRRELRKHVGDVARPCPNFRWQAFGEWDRRYRIEHSGLAPENVVALGSAYSDWLMPGSAIQRGFDHARVQSHYPIDLARPTVLLALTWHHGGSLSHWGDEADLLDRLLRHIEALGANALVRMHDRQRYEPDYVAMLEQLAMGRPTAHLKWKSSSPDSFVDLLISDAMISNYSSILNGFYHTGRPTLHIDPADAQGGDQYFRHLKGGRLQKKRMPKGSNAWKLDPSEIGGLRAQSFDELLRGLDQALADPQCCAERARAFCEEYVSSPDRRTCERIAAMLRDWVD